MTPYQFLLLTLGVTAACVAANLIHRRLRQRTLAEMARQWRMHYSPRDVFHLARHIAAMLPEAGAAGVSVVDVIYGIEGNFHRYIFSVEYTLGVIHSKRRIIRVASFREPRGQTDPQRWSELELVDQNLPLLEQYQQLHAKHEQVPSPAQSGVVS